MGIYQLYTAGVLSDVLAFGDGQHEAMRTLEHGSTEPTIKVTGMLWSCTNGTILTGLGLVTHAVIRWNGSAWEKFLPGFGGSVLPTGGGTLTGTLNANGNRILGLPAPGATDDPARDGDTVRRDGTKTLTADWNLGGGRKITGAIAPTVDDGLATKGYVDAAGVQEFRTLNYAGAEALVNLGYVPAKVLVATKGAIAVFQSGAVDAYETRSGIIINGASTTCKIKRRDGTAPAPNNVLGFNIDLGATPHTDTHLIIWR